MNLYGNRNRSKHGTYAITLRLHKKRLSKGALAEHLDLLIRLKLLVARVVLRARTAIPVHFYS